MQKTVFIYEPTDQELKAIEDSWLDDFQQNKQSLTAWFQERFKEFVLKNNVNKK